MSDVETIDINLDGEKDTDVPVEFDSEQDGTLRVTGNLDDIKETVAEPEFTMPDKFQGKSAEEIAKAYVELEKFKAQKAEEPKVEEPVVEPEAAPESTETTVESSSVVKDAQDMWAQQGGQLTEQQWNDLQAKTGIPMDTLKAYENYVKNDITASLESHDQKVYAESGGEESYNTMIEWADKNYSAEQIDALNTMLDSPQFYQKGIHMLKTQYQEAVGHEPSVTVQDKSNVSALADDDFHSEEEFHAAMNHPDYGKGGKYDRDFDRKALRYMKRTGQI